MTTLEHLVLIKPGGAFLCDSTLSTEADLWSVGLGWPDGEEIERAKKAGYFVSLATLQYHHENCDVNDRNPDGIKKPCNCVHQVDAAIFTAVRDHVRRVEDQLATAQNEVNRLSGLLRIANAELLRRNDAGY